MDEPFSPKSGEGTRVTPIWLKWKKTPTVGFKLGMLKHMVAEPASGKPRIAQPHPIIGIDSMSRPLSGRFLIGCVFLQTTKVHLEYDTCPQGSQI